jgi:hypothetical protein
VALLPSPNCPNWFYYWKEGNVCGIPQSAQYDATAQFGYARPSVDSIIRLGPLAPTTNTGPETYRKKDMTRITVTGQGKGIQCVAETVTHEQNHLTIYNQFKGATDSDGDGVGNTGEPTYQSIATDPQDPDTYQMSGSYSSYGDNEIRCRNIELSPISYSPRLDWALPGCQSKDQFGPQVK